MAKKKRFAFTDTQLQAVQGRRRSNAAGPHDHRPKRLRTRGAARRHAIQEG